MTSKRLGNGRCRHNGEVGNIDPGAWLEQSLVSEKGRRGSRTYRTRLTNPHGAGKAAFRLFGYCDYPQTAASQDTQETQESTFAELPKGY